MNACRKRSMTLRSFKALIFLLEIKGCRGVRRGSWAAPRGCDGGEDGSAARPNLAFRPAGASRACWPILIPGIYRQSTLLNSLHSFPFLFPSSSFFILFFLFFF